MPQLLVPLCPRMHYPLLWGSRSKETHTIAPGYSCLNALKFCRMESSKKVFKYLKPSLLCNQELRSRLRGHWNTRKKAETGSCLVRKRASAVVKGRSCNPLCETGWEKKVSRAPLVLFQLYVYASKRKTRKTE